MTICLDSLFKRSQQKILYFYGNTKQQSLDIEFTLRPGVQKSQLSLSFSLDLT